MAAPEKEDENSLNITTIATNTTSRFNIIKAINASWRTA